ncbi:MAG: glycosyltransferase family 4 protein [Kiritimatiellia bacterium]|jgi:glycosyltransferase involved in cell wall biosynthesis
MKNILFLEKVFRCPSDKSPGGVELFNLSLLRDLTGMGYKVTVPAHRSWAPLINDATADSASSPEIVTLPGNLNKMIGNLATLWRLRRRRFDLALLGNTGDRLIPMLLPLRRMTPRFGLIAHREPSAGFVRTMRKLPIDITAVNGQIAAHFTRSGITAVRVRYGILHSELFYPATSPTPRPNINFCVLGNLERSWKGHDVAVAAFQLLPQDIKQKCRLHLAGFSNPPTFQDAGIIPYPWQPYKQIGEFLRGMDVMIVPSRDEGVMRETFSQAAVQGMLTGLPLIVSDLPILTEKLDQGGGMVFRDVNDLADIMRRLAEDAPLRRRLGEQGRQTALARYIWDTRKFMAAAFPDL